MMMNSNFDIYKFQGGGMLPTQENLTFKGANIDFGDYISPDTRLIASNAAFAQKTANDRLDDLMKERQKIIDAVQLDKQFAKLQGQFIGQLDSLVEQAAKSQLSDNANFTKFNTGLISIKRDPAIQNALKSTEYAKAYADMRIKNPEMVDKPYLNNGMERDFLRFKNGETDEFVLRPAYTEPKWQAKIFEGIKNLPQEEKEVFKTQGSAIFQEKTKGLNEQRAYNSANSIVNYLLTSDPETASHFKRMKEFGYDPLPELQNTVKAAVDQYKNESITLSNMQANPNMLTAYQQQQIAQENRRIGIAERNALDGGGVRTGVTGSPLVDYGDREIYVKGKKDPITDTDRQFKMKKLLIESKQDATGKKPILLSDTDGTFAKDENGSNIRYNETYSPTGDFYDKGNSVFVEVKAPDDTPYYVKYSKDVFEGNVLRMQTPPSQTPATKQSSKKQNIGL
jgi:hypothetical protein